MDALDSITKINMEIGVNPRDVEIVFTLEGDQALVAPLLRLLQERSFIKVFVGDKLLPVRRKTTE